MPHKTLKQYGKQLKKYLSHFGEVGFIEDIEPNPHGFNYVGIELIAQEQIIKGLQGAINSRLNSQNGIVLKLEFQKWGEETKERYRYKARITSDQPLGEQAYADNLKTYLPQLGKAIKNATFQEKTCRERVRRIRHK